MTNYIQDNKFGVSFVTAEVYEIAHTHLNLDNFKSFCFDDPSVDYKKAQYQIDLRIGFDRDLEILPEIAGRLCYMSFGTGRNTNKEYLGHILNVGHGCYDGETEVLTDKGWIRFDEVHKISSDTKFATRTCTGIIEYQKASNQVNIAYSGRMYKVKARGVDLLVTPNHNMLVCPTTTKEGRKRNNYSLIKAEELNNISHAYVKNGLWEIESNYDIDFNFLRLLGFAIGDGYFDGRYLSFHLHKKRKIDWLCKLADILKSSYPDWEFKIDPTKTRYRFVSKDPVFLYLFSQIYNDNRDKCIPNKLIMDCSKEQLEALFEGLIESDGHRASTGGICFDTTSKVLADQMQHLCLHIGLAANVCYVYDKEKRKSSFGDLPLTRLSIIQRELKPEINKHSGAIGKSSWIDKWKGQVYCVTVPNNTLYVRREGKPVWCGNSVLEHSSISFLITGISRSLSHEFVRHRVGWSYSQISQRFVDSSEVRFIIPPAILLLDEADQDIFLKDCAANLQLYEDLAKKLAAQIKETYPDLSNTDRRKYGRGAARSILPNCTETKMVATCNIRAMRHFIEMRANPAADVEIRNLAIKMFLIGKELAPNLFNDYEEIKMDDGSIALETKTRKV